MNPEQFFEAKWLKNRTPEIIKENYSYRKKHTEFKYINFPKEYYFRIRHDINAINWAIIVKENKKYSIYFININGQAFDKLVYNDYWFARKALKKNKFY